ncbi:MAG: hypothetical protein Q7J26_02090 [Brevundimonas sp.]|uniref:hypothetical protein n=1 Tax=Brevundimonas sp. TaxID=1871086 RepID=UPI00271783F6|nr:hypothetical protein [Brevundimonas sp.]MDO9607288.1 hypothetical protein [Brevundimonas sp.]
MIDTVLATFTLIAMTHPKLSSKDGLTGFAGSIDWIDFGHRNLVAASYASIVLPPILTSGDERGNTVNVGDLWMFIRLRLEAERFLSV